MHEGRPAEHGGAADQPLHPQRRGAHVHRVRGSTPPAERRSRCQAVSDPESVNTSARSDGSSCRARCQPHRWDICSVSAWPKCPTRWLSRWNHRPGSGRRRPARPAAGEVEPVLSRTTLRWRCCSTVVKVSGRTSPRWTTSWRGRQTTSWYSRRNMGGASYCSGVGLAGHGPLVRSRAARPPRLTRDRVEHRPRPGSSASTSAASPSRTTDRAVRSAQVVSGPCEVLLTQPPPARTCPSRCDRRIRDTAAEEVDHGVEGALGRQLHVEARGAGADDERHDDGVRPAPTYLAGRGPLSVVDHHRDPRLGVGGPTGQDPGQGRHDGRPRIRGRHLGDSKCWPAQ